MRLRLQKWTLCKAVLAAVCGLIGSSAFAQYSTTSYIGAPRPYCPPPPVCQPAPGTTTMPYAEPGTTTLPRTDPSTMPGTMPGATAPAATAPSLSGETGGAGLGSAFAVADPNYIDGAVPRTQFRLRYDSFYGDNRPDRADFFYPKCGCFRIAGLDPNAKGPPLPESNIDSQQLSAYIEVAASERLSGFVEVPERWINPTNNANASGLSDINFGFKYAFLFDECQVGTFQLRASAPTGDPGLGLGTNNWAVEPAFLYERRLSEKLFLLGELRDFIPIAAQDNFSGNVLRYGLGLSYIVYNDCNLRIAPIAEVVGWSVLSGKEFALDINAPQNTKDASGDTIVNAKIGTRFSFGATDGSSSGILGNSDLALSYGRALTGTVWYKDIFRVEYRLRF